MRIAVFPEFRGQGYSRELMDRMEKSAAEKAVNALSLEVRAGSAAQKLLSAASGRCCYYVVAKYPSRFHLKFSNFHVYWYRDPGAPGECLRAPAFLNIQAQGGY